MENQIKQTLDKAYVAVNDALAVTKGKSAFSILHDAMSGIDTVKTGMHMSEIEDHGLTFFTRPRLNLTTNNLRSDRIMMMLDTLEKDTMAYGIRTLLDTDFTSIYNKSNDSPFVNDTNPFIPMLTNRLVGLSGWPDPVLDVWSSDAGFFSESISYPNGHDQLSKTYDLTATFNDVQGSVILSIFLMWTRYISLVSRGVMVAYMKDIEERRMAFSSGIYRFVLDPSKQYITKWAKATGCFPRSISLGSYFNYDYNASNVEGSMNMSIPIHVMGKIEYMDPIILHEFNMLVEMRNPAVKNFTVATPDERLALNFCCIPYVNMNTNALEWRYDPKNQKVIDRMKSVKKLWPDDNQDKIANNTSLSVKEAREIGIIGA